MNDNHITLPRYKGKDLLFISQINRDGSGTIPVSKEYIKLMKSDMFTINGMSMSERTYIACGFNSFVVRIKKFERLITKTKAT